MNLLDQFERLLDRVIPPPEDVVASVLRGEALCRAGDPDGALRIADSALQAAPGYLRALSLRVDALDALGRPYDALAALDQAQSLRPLPPQLLARAVALAASLGDGPRALNLAALLRARAPQVPPPSLAAALATAARALIARGDPVSGLRLARAATTLHPERADAWLLLGQDAALRGDMVRARAALDRALGHLDLGDAASHRAVGELAAALGDQTTAERALRRAWILGDDGALMALVDLLAREHDGVAGAALERLLADAGGAFARVARAVTGLLQGDETAARALTGEDIPEALWGWTLSVAVPRALGMAAAWCDAAPSRPSAGAVRALRDADVLVRQGEPAAALARLPAALDDALTTLPARALRRAAHLAAWEGRVGAALDDLAELVSPLPGGEAAGRELRALRRELDGPLRVALLGEFSAGKSTFLNAWVGAEVSPMGVLPTTVTVHWLRHGPPAARVVEEGGAVTEVGLTEASAAVARRRAAGARVARVELTVPLPSLAQVELLDTPGFNAGDAAHDAAVRSAFDLADVGLWLFDARQAGRQSEVEPLEAARAQGLPVVGVLNKIDQCAPANRPALLAHLGAASEALAPCVAAVSARQALDARLRLALAPPEDAAPRETLDASGWPALQGWIDRVLLAQRDRWKQARVARRAVRVLLGIHDALAAEARDTEARRAALAALAEALTVLREALPAVASAARNAVDQGLREQRLALGGGRDAQALLDDAVAEAVWRARARGLEALAVPLEALEAGAVAAGLLRPEAAGLVTAPAVLRLEAAIAEGVRDAAMAVEQPGLLRGLRPGMASLAASTPLSANPFAALEAALDVALTAPGRADEGPRDALDAGLAALQAVTPPDP